jgi:signal transduction histidine kinase
MRIHDLARPRYSFRILMRSSSRRPRSALIFALLLLTVAAAGMLAYEAEEAARSHSRVAEGVLQSYVGSASWEFARVARRDLDAALASMLAPSQCATTLPFLLPPPDPHHQSTPQARPITSALDIQFLASQSICDCPPIGAIANYFRLNVKSGASTTSGPALAPRVAARLLTAVRAHARSLYIDVSPPAIALLDGGGRGLRVFGFVVVNGARRGDEEAFGFEAEPPVFATILERVFQHESLLPAALTSDATNGAVLAVEATDPLGRLLYRSAPVDDARFSSTHTLEPRFGALRVRATLKPDSANRLVIGGVPRSRLPLLAGLLGLTIALVMIALHQLRREYDLVRLRADFVSGVSHELRTPLAQIRMFSETLLLGRIRSEEEEQRSLTIIDQEARRLTQLVDNVLLFSRSERCITRLAPEATTLDSFVAEVVEAFLPLARARNSDVRLDAPDMIVASVDRSAVRQMLLNLLDNAVKYGPAGQTVRVSVRHANGRARIVVDDEGPGIHESDRMRVWEPFCRLERDRESAVAGTGIGLAVVRDLCRRHDGHEWIETSPSGGTSVVIELPGAQVGSSSVDAQHVASHRMRTAARPA